MATTTTTNRCASMNGNTPDDEVLSNVLSCQPPNIVTTNSNKFYAQVQVAINYMQWILGVLAVASLILIAINIITSRISNDPNKSAQSLQAIGFVFLGLLISEGAVTIIKIIWL